MTDYVEVIYKTVYIEGVPVDWMTINPLIENNENIILIIPGNPGLVSFYEQFAKTLFNELGKSVAVWCISHSCHCVSKRPLPRSSYRCCLKDEVTCKVKFIREHVPKGINLTLVGHSIGCYMILEAMEQLEGNTSASSTSELHCCPGPSIRKSVLLFPTIERMKVTPNGVCLWPLLKYLKWLVVMLACIVYFLPTWVKRRVALWHLDGLDADHCVVDGTLQMLHPRLVNNMLALAYNELQTVTDLNTGVICKFKEKLVFYYGTTDGWCPLFYRDELLHRVPGVAANVCNSNINHAFVIKSSESMATTVSQIIKLNKK